MKKACSLRSLLSVAAAVGLIALTHTSCLRDGPTSQAGNPDLSPERVIEWSRRNLTLSGMSDDSIYGVSDDPTTLQVLRWEGNSLTRRQRVELPYGMVSIALLAEDKFICNGSEPDGEGWGLKVCDLNDGKVMHRWKREKNWSSYLSRPSRNGKHVVVWEENSNLPEQNIRIGMLSPKAEKVEPIVVAAVMAGAIYNVVPSDNGAYVAFAGWDNGTMLVDVEKKKVLWTQGLETDSKDVAFSPDSKIVYAGGMKGRVYGMSVESGKILTRWWATASGREEPGHRISTLSVSPDGRFVAAGTGPEGQVFLFSADTGELLRVLNHGGSTIFITHFAPDSKRLATVAAGQIKIWAIPEKDEKGSRSRE
jgi:WD40 repeat protein